MAVIDVSSSWFVDENGHTHRIDAKQAQYLRVAAAVGKNRNLSVTKQILAALAAARKLDRK